ncbi:efflux RND transporter periplasmic adaptor subunit [Arenibaculum pallidiluteum]|uniref:efflux RND transporter periplasmic adaptor subunit n=1 Tax=Arenibaculum pallidiluteum TaxID=2812559 RepID=UPI001A96274A|nr:efflux RND transporter periplasmic adaptor subunit [Arenibaculum pallidiluteum]
MTLIRLFPALLVILGIAGPLAAQDLPAPSSDELGVALERQIRAQLVPRRNTPMASPMAGRIVELPWRDGEAVKEGQVVVRFDCAIQQSQLARSRAALEKRRRVREVNERLVKLGSVTRLDVDVNEAEVQEAAAEVRLMEAMVARCTVTAPFAGRIVDVPARQWQFIGEGQPLLEIADDGELEAEMIVPSAWLSWLGPGHGFAVAIEETGRSYPATVVRLAGRVDPVSRSIKVYARLSKRAPELLAGMSGRALIEPPDGAREAR